MYVASRGVALPSRRPRAALPQKARLRSLGRFFGSLNAAPGPISWGMLARLSATHLPLRAPTCVGRSVPLRRSKGVNSSRQPGWIDGFVSKPSDQLTGPAANLTNVSEDHGKLPY